MNTTQVELEVAISQCIGCGCDIPRGDGYSPSNMGYRPGGNTEELLCTDCAIVCENCSDTVDVSDTQSVLGNRATWCVHCCDEYLCYCGDCDAQLVREDSYYCESVGHCDESYLCEGCYSEHDNGSIHDYGYKPEPQFMGKGPRYFGVELEIDGAGQNKDNADEILAHSKGESLFYIKSDSSLEDGMEIVSHPCSLDYHLKSFPWDDISRTARSLGYKSHDAGTCGLHVHVSRRALGHNYSARELTVSKLIILLWRHWPNLYRFSRRSSDRWCRQQYSFDNLSRAGLVDAKAKGHSVALNVDNADTIEFRIFRGSLNTNTLRAALKLVDVLVDVALSRGILWIAQSRWDDILAECKADKNLWQYLTLKGLTR